MKKFMTWVTAIVLSFGQLSGAVHAEEHSETGQEEQQNEVYESDLITVSFDSNGGVFPWSDEEKVHVIQVAPGESLQEYPDPYSVTPGKVFKGWSLDNDDEVDLVKYDVFDYVPEHDEYYYAVWTDGYSITLDANGGYFFGDHDRTQAVISVLKDEPARENPVPMTDTAGTGCAGWSFNKGEDVDIYPYDLPDFVPDRDLTLYAVWKNGYTVRADAGEGYFWGPEDRELEVFIPEGDEMQLPWPRTDQSGRVFTGWSFTVDGETVILNLEEADHYRPVCDISVSALWADGYRITLDANGGRFDWDDEGIVPVQDVFIPEGEPTRAGMQCISGKPGYVFAGWSREKDDSAEIGRYEMFDYVPSSDETFYAVYVKGYVITLDTNGGRFDWDDERREPVKDIYVTEGESTHEGMWCIADEPGYVFTGWSYEKDDTVEIGKDDLYDYVPSSDKTLYAVYTKGYVITLDTSGGRFDWDDEGSEPVKNIYVPEGESTHEGIWCVSKEPGFAFVGWSYEKDDTVEIGKDELYDYVPSSDETLYAVYVKGYTVTIDANGGRFDYDDEGREPVKVVYIPEGEPTHEGMQCISGRPGYVFAGWSYEKDDTVEIGKYDLHDYVPSSDETFYAVYVKGYVITLDTNGGRFDWDDEGSEPVKDIYVPEGESTHEGMWCVSKESGLAFAGWSYEKDDTVEIRKDDLYDHVPTADETLYAVYVKGYAVTIDPNGGRFEYDDEGREPVKVVYIPEGEPVHEGMQCVSGRPGYVFAGWSRKKDGAADIGKYDLFEYVPSGDEVFYAVYVKGYVITLDTNGGRFEWDEEGREPVRAVYVPEGEATHEGVQCIPGKPESVFAGWSSEKDGAVEIGRFNLANYVPTEDETLYAVYKEAYTIAFDANGGTFGEDTQEQVIYQSVAKDEPMMLFVNCVSTKPGYVFGGWSHKKDGGLEIGKYDLRNYVPSGDETLYAVYVKGYVTTFDANGGRFEFFDDDSEQTLQLETIKGEKFDRGLYCYSMQEGYVFAGWSRERGGDLEISDGDLPEYVPEKDETLYAVYKEGYTVSFDANGGGRFYWDEWLDVYTVGVVAGNSINEYPDPVSTIPGKVFAGWSYTKDGDVDMIKYDVADHVPENDEYYFAVYKDGSNIRLEANGGYWFGDRYRTFVTVSVVKDTKAAESPVPMTDNEKVFAGWAETPDGEVVMTSEEFAEHVPAGDKTYYAVWKEDTPEMDKVFRLSGSTRWDTCLSIADELKEVLGVEQFSTVVVANGMKFADALAGGYLAAKNHAPILIINPAKSDSMEKMKEYIRNNVVSGGKVYILGGTGAVPESMKDGLNGYNIVRLGGDDRYQTNMKILAEAGVSSEDILIAAGGGFADSLSASASGRPILLVGKKGLTEDQKTYLKGKTQNKWYILGGTGAISEDTEKQLKALGNTPERLSGNGRYETSVAIANAFAGNAKAVVLAYGTKFPDGLCGGPLAAEIGAPLILTKDKEKTESAKKFAEAGNIKAGYILGGKAVLADETAESILGSKPEEK